MNGFLCQGLGQERDCTIKWGNVFGKGPSSEAAVGAREMQGTLVAPLGLQGLVRGRFQKVRGPAGHKL